MIDSEHDERTSAGACFRGTIGASPTQSPRVIGSTMSDLTDLFAEIPADRSEELFQTLLDTPSVRIERIVSQGQSSPEGFWYDQEDHEWVVLLKGAAKLTLEGVGSVDLRPGGFVNIPAHQRHRVEWTDPTQPTVWLAIHYQEGRP
jgi:cupin 2 domain-containing protein